MKIPFTRLKLAIQARPLLVLIIALCALVAAVPWRSGAQPQTASIQVVNNSSRQIRHLYLSPVDEENWGPDQLNDQTIQPGGSFTVSNVSCSGPEVKVIGEDEQGCFVTQVVGCTGDAVWTITNDATPNCGN
jgi:hypothetical protein